MTTEGSVRRPLHHFPPLTPAGVLARKKWVVGLVAGLFVALAVAARVHGGELLLTWDRPVQLAVEDDLRRPWLTPVVRWASHLGGITVVVIGLVVLVLFTYRRCRALALVLVTASAARPLLEHLLKEAVGRDRPDFTRLVPGNGPSFPSGHVMAAVALWGVLPPVVALLTGRRRWWWLSVATSGIAVASVAFARVYLGVHWLSDVVGSLLLGALYLMALEFLLARWHPRSVCGVLGPEPGDAPPARDPPPTRRPADPFSPSSSDRSSGPMRGGARSSNPRSWRRDRRNAG